jgi:hypothetical protein
MHRSWDEISELLPGRSAAAVCRRLRGRFTDHAPISEGGGSSGGGNGGGASRDSAQLVAGAGPAAAGAAAVPAAGSGNGIGCSYGGGPAAAVAVFPAPSAPSALHTPSDVDDSGGGGDPKGLAGGERVCDDQQPQRQHLAPSVDDDGGLSLRGGAGSCGGECLGSGTGSFGGRGVVGALFAQAGQQQSQQPQEPLQPPPQQLQLLQLQLQQQEAARQQAEERARRQESVLQAQVDVIKGLQAERSQLQVEQRGFCRLLACIRCVAGFRVTAFLPCRHLTHCSSCAADVRGSECPTCKTLVTDLIDAIFQA